MQKALLNLIDSNLISQIIDKLLAKSTSVNSKDDFSSILEQLKDSPQSQTNIDGNSKKFLSALDELINKQPKNTQLKHLSKNIDSISSDLLNLLFLIQNNNTVSNFQNQKNISDAQKTFNQTFKDIKELVEAIKAQAYSEIQQNAQNDTKPNTQDLQPEITNEKILAQINKKTPEEKNFGVDLKKATLQNNKQLNTQLIEQTQDSKKQNQQESESTSNKRTPTIQITKNTIADSQVPSNKTVSINAELEIDNKTQNNYSLDQKQQILQQTSIQSRKQIQQNSPLQSKSLNSNEILTQVKSQIQQTKTSTQEINNNASTNLQDIKEQKTASSNTANPLPQNNSYNDSSGTKKNKPQNQNLQSQNINQPQQKFTQDTQTTKTISTQEIQLKQLQTQDTLQSQQELDKNQQQLSQNTNSNLTQNTIAQTDNISFQKIPDAQNANAPKQPYPINQIIEKIIELQNLKPPVIKSITIQVNPPSLGQIDVKVSIDTSKSLSATIHVENREIFNIVNDNLDSLKANISSQGLNVSQINVISSSNQGQQNFTQNQNQPNQLLFQFSQNFSQSSSGQGQNSFNQAFNQQKQQNYVFESSTKQIKRIFKNPNALLDISI
ncbi:MAG TPA: flagellar hook-length control protein FliK [Desulfurella acetivorans]|uniref:Flagellar hook-length control protein FliK n=1 Tax=Desulfurella acetivorans TaxID=33002 RepID=A0A7C6A8E9_DESAE|nr:flagellar hook-length control protein FliK [Desulfurella acetivorans]